MATVIKRGATFSFSGAIEGAKVNGVSVSDFTGWTATSQIRQASDALIDDLVFAWIDETAGTFRISKADTSSWPVEKRALVDIRFVATGGEILITGTAEFEIIEPETQL